ncbi:MAG: Flp pilus assembly complex ATPase component TadA [Holophagaceae bacterium]|nr:Flp pilus assembly complex ATPase component TadA [Holophagaceae bacterium]
MNATRTEHILTIEDPIGALPSGQPQHREPAGGRSDCKTFSSALRAALRQDPDDPRG